LTTNFEAEEEKKREVTPSLQTLECIFDTNIAHHPDKPCISIPQKEG
jgi:hypothetical protein